MICVKDQYDTADMRTTSGGDVAFANDRPPRDATFVERLRQAGAIILAKANLGEMAGGIPRSSFGGVFVNAYNTERSPGVSSAGSGTAVAANLCTCAIGEETGSSIRGPASYNSCVGLSPTQELVSRDGMIGAGINTRVGPICRSVEDVAKVLSVIAGHDPRDELTAFSVGRLPPHRYESYASGRADGIASLGMWSVPDAEPVGGQRHTEQHKPLAGVRLGVVREFMDTAILPVSDHGNIAVVDKAIEHLRHLGAEIVEPADGDDGLFTPYIRRLYPALLNAAFVAEAPELFPEGADEIMTLARLAESSVGTAEAEVLAGLSYRQVADLDGEPAGEQRFFLERYLQQRGDTAIGSVAQLLEHSTFFEDSSAGLGSEGGRVRQTMEGHAAQAALDTAPRMQRRFAMQQIVLACMADLRLTALVHPTNNLPPQLLGTPLHQSAHGRNGAHASSGRRVATLLVLNDLGAGFQRPGIIWAGMAFRP